MGGSGAVMLLLAGGIAFVLGVACLAAAVRRKEIG
jgi:hypothetical protein